MKQKSILLRILQGALIGLGAVLPGISGGVLSVVFGIYKPVMELLGDPIRRFKTHLPALIPVFLGGALGFFGVARLLAFFLEAYPAVSVCVFVGLIGGMLPSLFAEAGAKGRNRRSLYAFWISAALVFVLLAFLDALSLTLMPSFGWYVFCGICLALSLLVPGLSFSTLLMPIGLYTPFVDGIGSLSFDVLLPGGMGALLVLLLLPGVIDSCFNRFYAAASHAVLGIVVGATLMTVPFREMFASPQNLKHCLMGLSAGLLLACLADYFPKADKPGI